MPPSPFDNLINNLMQGLEEAAQDFLKDVNKDTRRNLRDLSKAAREASRPLPKDKKRVQRGPRGSKVPPPDKSQMASVPTLYDFLEVSRFASPETVSAAFRSLSARFHPDNQKTGNEARYKDITAAWTVLKNPEKRKKYDREIGLNTNGASLYE